MAHVSRQLARLFLFAALCLTFSSAAFSQPPAEKGSGGLFGRRGPLGRRGAPGRLRVR